jgi:hypothetical protein
MQLNVEVAGLREIIIQTVEVVLSQRERIRAELSDRLAYDEPTAAALLDLNPWQLGDLRREGKIGHTRIVRNQVRYLHRDLMEYLLRQHQPGTPSSDRPAYRRVAGPEAGRRRAARQCRNSA